MTETKTRISDLIKAYPYFYYKRLNLSIEDTAYFYLENGFTYRLQRIAVLWPNLIGGGEANTLEASIFFGETDFPLQAQSTPFNLISTPGAVDQTAAGILAGQRKILFTFEYLYLPQGIIKVQISGQSPGNPTEARIMVEGRKARYDQGQAL